MKSFKPEYSALTALRIIILVISVVLIGAVRIYVPINAVVLIFSVAVIIADIFMIFVYLPVYFSSLSYEMTEEKIIRHSGVFMKSHQSVRYSTVQYSVVVTTPFSDKTGLNFVVLFVYGGSLRLIFLKKSDAMEILRRCGDV
ncbi:MAG: PH domain-containing protein [Ruminococcus flavefaciens]|nr:PH domain-containing protein [Ruminococcus flavefaciens]MCM1229224.1 PH domain-containing protein [Ruminococcus flavefaciens]